MKENGSTFLDFLQSGMELDVDLIIGGADMPASFVWDDSCRLTAYGKTLFHDLLAAEYQVLPNGNVEIFCDDYALWGAILSGCGRVHRLNGISKNLWRVRKDVQYASAYQ